MSAAERLLDTENYDSEEDFVDEVLTALDTQNSVFIYGPDHETYGLEAYVEAQRKVVKDNFWSQISLNPVDWINPDLYKVTRQETEEGIRINYVQV